MRTYVIQRLLLAVPTLFGITVLIFVAMRVLPGDPLKTIYFEGGGARILNEEEYLARRQDLGLDRPLHLQYLGWMADVFRGDLGKSFWHQKPIRETIQRRGAITVEYALMAVALSWVVGLPVGLIAAVWRNSWLDYCRSVPCHPVHGHPQLLAGPYSDSDHGSRVELETAFGDCPPVG